MPSFQPVRFGKYLLLEKLAVGGMAQLYRAKITGVQGFEKLIAIKQILPHLAAEKELVSAFIDEAKLAALLNHQNIVQIYDFGEMEGSYFISMEYLLGKDLRIIANKSRENNLPLGFAYAIYIASRICSGLDYAHKLKDFQGKPLNIIHRDISPQNILITHEGDVKIVDFGIAKAASQSTITQVGMIKGKVAYMSPEQAAGKTIDHRSDIFSAGILLYEMVTGTRMFKGDTLQILSKVREAEFDPPERVTDGLPPKLYEILHLTLAKDPGQRYQSCAEMLADLEECMYALSQRPTTRGLAQYMKKLFEEEIAAEENIMRKAAQITIPGELGAEKDVRPAKKNEEAKTGLVGEEAAPGKQKKPGLLYGVLAAVLTGIVLVFVFWPKEKPPSAPDRGLPTVSRKVLPSTPAKASEKVPNPQARARALQDQALKLIGRQPNEARSLLLQAIQLDPKSVQGHFQLGLVYMQLKNYPKAIETYHKVTELSPQFSDAFFNLGYVYAKTKDYARAEEMYSRTVKLAPSYLDEALFNLAMVQKRQGKTKETIKNLEQALRVNPHNKLAKESLHKLKTHSGGNQ